MDEIMLRIKEHDIWRGDECLNLIPSENRTSSQVQSILASDMSRRYSLPLNQEVHGSLVENAYRGTRYLDEVENLGEKLACKVFGAKHASLKPLSGHVSALIALLSTCKRGDRILTINSMHGGYDGYMPEYIPAFLGLEIDFLPFDVNKWNLEADASAEVILEKKPKAVVIGSSFILFPYALKELSEACEKVDARLLYDASHVLGLMPWNWQDPLGEGVDLLYGSTHKSFFGPQGGLILTNDDSLFERIQDNMTWRILDNAHWNRIAALTQALLEFERFGREYGAQVVRNSEVLGSELTDQGLPIRFKDQGYSKSHMTLMDEGVLKSKHGLSFNEFAVGLERSNIIVDAVGRFGANELTRLGAREEHMKITSELVAAAIKGNVSGDVKKLRGELDTAFCF
jgi:glycine hydroxymethyltransferase